MDVLASRHFFGTMRLNLAGNIEDTFSKMCIFMLQNQSALFNQEMHSLVSRRHVIEDFLGNNLESWY